ncbi:MAG: hypothetical protein AB7F22_02450 [Reyranella sp.]|uniref:bestrophin-like domain n=1 Tax=Reyranella sp. TaxID=1929291 RepID=UPI003D137270
MLLDLNDYPLLAIFPVSLVLILGAGEVGHWLGERAARRGAPGVSTLEAAILGLLALMIGFTFSMALSRFEARRDGVVIEAAAIGTTALRARLLPAPHDREVVKLLRDYVQLRLDLTKRPVSLAEFNDAISRSNAIQEALWRQAKAVAAKDNGMVPTGLFLQSLNEMIDDQEKRLAALHNRLPAIIVIALYGVSIVGVGFAGYGSGVETKRSRLPVHLMGVLVAAMVLLIQDIDRPGAGFIKVSQQSMASTAALLAGFPDQAAP